MNIETIEGMLIGDYFKDTINSDTNRQVVEHCVGRETNFKVGDIVTIGELTEDVRNTVKEMVHYSGRTTEITKLLDNGCFFVDIDGRSCVWNWYHMTEVRSASAIVPQLPPPNLPRL